MDTKTLAITLVISLAAQACLATVLAISRRDRAITTWALGFVASALGFALLLTQGWVSPVFSIVLANLLMILFNFALVLGGRYFLKVTPIWPWRFLSYFIVWIGLELALTFVWPLYNVRASLTSLATVLMIGELLLILWKSRRRIDKIIRNLFFTLIATVVAFHGVRAVLVISSTVQGMWADEFITASTLIFSLVSSYVWSGALLIWDGSRLQAEVVEQTQELKRLNDLKDRVMAMTGHDLRGPMGNLQLLWSALGERLRQRDFSAVDDELLGMVDRSLAGTQSLLDNLFSFAESQQSSHETHPRSDLALALLQVASQWEAPAQTKQLTLEIVPGESLWVRAGSHALEAVFRNLVGNAVKFTPSHGTIRVSVQALPEHRVEVHVTDSGVGMTKEWIENVFRLDRKVSRPGTNGERGSGFGLALVRELVSAWSGTLKVESTPGSGTTVRVTIPLD